MSRLATAALSLLAGLAPNLARADVDVLVARALGDDLPPAPTALAATRDGLAVTGAGARLWSAFGEPDERRLSGEFTDVAATRDGLALVGPAGLIVLDAAGAVAWSIDRATFGASTTRWHVAADADTLAVLAGSSVHTFTADGRPLARWTADAALADIAVATDLVVTTGARTVTCADEPRDVVVLTAHDRDGASRWSAYDHASASLCAAGPLVAAGARGVAVARGDDGLLYFLAEADGADSPLRYHPQHLTVRAGNVIFDSLSDPEEAQRGTLAYYARFDRAGEHLGGQFLGLPATDSEPSRLSPRAIAATASGLVIVAGATDRVFAGADELPGTEPLGQHVGFVQLVDPDLGARAWHLLEDLPGEHAVVDVALVGGSVVGLVVGASVDGDAVVDLPLAAPEDDPTFRKKVTKHPDNDTQATFGFESGVSGSDPTCYCDAAPPRPAGLLALGVFALVGLRRPRARR